MHQGTDLWSISKEPSFGTGWEKNRRVFGTGDTFVSAVKGDWHELHVVHRELEPSIFADVFGRETKLELVEPRAQLVDANQELVVLPAGHGFRDARTIAVDHQLHRERNRVVIGSGSDDDLKIPGTAYGDDELGPSRSGAPH